MDMYRQGDVLIRRVDGKRAGKRRDSGIIAYGEATGHAHRVVGDAAVYEAAADRLLIEVTGTAEVIHDEHGTIPIGPGLYEVVGQREYAPEEIRRVAD